MSTKKLSLSLVIPFIFNLELNKIIYGESQVHHLFNIFPIYIRLLYLSFYFIFIFLFTFYYLLYLFTLFILFLLFLFLLFYTVLNNVNS